MKLNRFGEAITWCDEGLAVSFTSKIFFHIFLSARLIIMTVSNRQLAMATENTESVLIAYFSLRSLFRLKTIKRKILDGTVAKWKFGSLKELDRSIKLIRSSYRWQKSVVRLSCRRFIAIVVSNLPKIHLVKLLNSKKIDKNNKKLSELKMRCVKEQTKMQKPDGEKTEKNLESHTVKGTVRLWDA